MIFGGYTFPELSERNILPALFHYCPGDRNLDTEEYVPLSILPFPGLEKNVTGPPPGKGRPPASFVSSEYSYILKLPTWSDTKIAFIPEFRIFASV